MPVSQAIIFVNESHNVSRLVNKSTSSNDIYVAIKVLNGVAWTQSLDAIFRENYDNDSTLSWQYFGSSDGFFRIYPGRMQNFVINNTCTGI
jgi:hypothetical protein